MAGTLLERELGNKIFVHTVAGEYACRVHNLRTFDAVARDVVQRWVYPFVPDGNWRPRGAGPSGVVTLGRRHVYREEGALVARSAEVGADTVLGAGCVVGDFSLVRKSVVGRGVVIGMRCLVDGCHLLDGATVGDHVQARGALVCAGAVLQPGSSVGPGAVVSFDCVLGKGFALPPGARLSLCPQPQASGGGSDDELEYAAAGGGAGGGGGEGDAPAQALGHDGRASSALDAHAAACLAAAKAGAPQAGGPRWPWPEAGCGSGGAGFRWQPADAEEWRFTTAPVAPSAAATEEAAEGDSDDEEARGGGAPGVAGTGAGPAPARGAPAQPRGAASDGGDGGGEESEGEVEGGDVAELHFRREVGETFLRCVKHGFEQANAVVELQGLKMAENRSFADLARAFGPCPPTGAHFPATLPAPQARYILTTLLSLCLPAPCDCSEEYAGLHPACAPASPVALVASLRPRLAQWAPLLRRFLKTEDDQVEMLLTFEEYAAEEDVFAAAGGGAFAGPAFAGTLKALYDCDVLGEDAALAWAQEKAGADGAHGGEMGGMGEMAARPNRPLPLSVPAHPAPTRAQRLTAACSPLPSRSWRGWRARRRTAVRMRTRTRGQATDTAGGGGGDTHSAEDGPDSGDGLQLQRARGPRTPQPSPPPQAGACVPQSGRAAATHGSQQVLTATVAATSPAASMAQASQ